MIKGWYTRLQKRLRDWLITDFPITEAPPCDFDRLKYEIRPGDVLLIEGHSRISNIIRTITQSPWTHAALYIGRLHDIDDHHLRKRVVQQLGKRENVRLIIEGLIDQGTVVTPLSNYKQQHIRICRPAGLSPEDTQLVIAYMINALGRGYSVRRLVDLARFLLPWPILPRRWGSILFRTPTGELENRICSSLLAEAFSSVKFPILPFMKRDEIGVEMIQRNIHLYTPKDFDYSPYFDIIKYPIRNPEEQTPYYRRMPWAEGVTHQDNGIITDNPPPLTTNKKEEN
jgi:hypothetical protein